MTGTPTRMSSSTSLLPRGCRHICGVPTNKGAPRPLLLARDGLRAPTQTEIAVSPSIAFCSAYRDHKGLPRDKEAGDGSPVKALSSALFWSLRREHGKPTQLYS